MPLAASHQQHGAGMPREIFWNKPQQFSFLTHLWPQSCRQGYGASLKAHLIPSPSAHRWLPSRRAVASRRGSAVEHVLQKKKKKKDKAKPDLRSFMKWELRNQTYARSSSESQRLKRQRSDIRLAIDPTTVKCCCSSQILNNVPIATWIYQAWEHKWSAKNANGFEAALMWNKMVSQC